MGKQKRKKKVSITRAKKRAWDAFSMFIRFRGSKNGYNTCVTCGQSRPIEGVGCMQAGHFIPGRGNSLIYHEQNCHPQCYVCNCMKDGNWVEYEDFMLRTYGSEVVDYLKSLRHRVVNMTADEHLLIEAVYKKKVEDAKALARRGQGSPS